MTLLILLPPKFPLAAKSATSGLLNQESYKDKLLNLFGEEATQKLHETPGPELQLKDKEDAAMADLEEGAGVEIPLSDEEWIKWSLPSTKTLVVKVMGKNVNFRTLDNNLQKKWPKKGSIKIVDMPDGYFLVYFVSEEDYAHALFEGPWMIADSYLIVQRWRPVFLQNAEKIKKVAVWIRIPRLPTELYNTNFLWRIGNGLGSMLRVDRLTSIHSRGQYARICV